MGSLNHIVIKLEGNGEFTCDGEPFLAVVRSNEAFVQGEAIRVTLRPDRGIRETPE